MSPWSALQRWWFLRGHRGTLRLAPGVRVEGRVCIPGAGTVVIGPGVRLASAAAAIELRAGPGAEISIGAGTLLEAGCGIEATSSVRVGARCRLGAFSKVMDNHFHEAAGDRSQRPPSVPVVLEEEVVLGPRAILLPGAHLGRGVRVGPGTVASRRLPPGAVFSGSPAKVQA